MYGVVCKPIRKSRDRRESESYPPTRFPIRSGLRNFLFFQIFISLVILTMPTTLWADPISLTVDADGAVDTAGNPIFRGGVDGLRIVFTVDDENEEDPYIIDVGNFTGSGENVKFVSLGVIKQGIVAANETVIFAWGGTINGARLPDGTYTIRVVVGDADDDDAQEEARNTLTATATVDTSVPRVSGVLANGNPNLLIAEGSFIKEPLRSIKVTAADDSGELNFGDRRTSVVLRNRQGVGLRGTLTYDDTGITYTLVNPLDAPSENGNYTLLLVLIDKAGNVVRSTREFTFDNVNPSLIRVATNRGVLTPGRGVSQRLNFVEVTLRDNLDDGVDSFASTVRLTGPGGTLLSGTQTETAGGRIRWNLLTPLLGEDDSQDGEYTIEVVAVDKAGNQTEPIDVLFFYDNLSPRLVSLSPTRSTESFNLVDDTIYYNLPIDGFVATFEDNGRGIDFTGTQESTRIVFGTPKKSGRGLNVRDGRVLTDSENRTLTYVLNEPIVNPDGSEDGTYTLNIQVTDTAGNTKSYTYQFIYDTQFPTLVSTTPAAGEIVSELSQVKIELSEKTSGIDFINSSFQLTRGDAEVPVNITSNGIDTATLTLAKPIALDGSDDGTYAIKATPADHAGNTGVTVVREFYLVSQKHEPEIRLVMPEMSIFNSLPTVVVELIDYIGSGIDFDASTLTVANSQGVLVPEEKLEYDEASNQLTWSTEVSVPRDGSADGEYTIAATLVDFTGRRFTQEFLIVLDTQIPALVSTVPAANEIVSSLSQIEVKLSELTSGIDFGEGMSIFRLTRDGVEVPVNRTSNGADTVILTLAEPIALDGSDDGTYAIEVSPTDRAGNTGVAVVREFYLVSQRHEPEVRLVTPETSIFNGLPTTIAVELIDYIGSGIDFDASTLTVSNPQGVLVPQEELEYNEASNQLTWSTLVTVPRDGSADGEYTIAATFVDFVGRRFTQEFLIVLDTQIPALVSTVPATNEIVSSLSQIEVKLSENTSGIDFVQSTFRLTRDGVEVPINRTSNGTGTVTLTLVAPIALDGSDDGTYTIEVTPTDRAGNTGATAMRKFYLVSQKHGPEVRLTMPQATRVSSLPTVGVELIGYVGAGIDFDASTVTVSNPQGVLVAQEELERDEASNLLTWTAAAPVARDGSADGKYTIIATFVDFVGRRFTREFQFVLDTQVPEIEHVHVKTSESETELSTDTITTITENFSQILVTFQEAVVSQENADTSPVEPDIDFANTVIELTGPEAAVPINISIHSATQLAVRFVELMEDGTYTLTITPQDILGNTAQGAVRYAFLLDTEAPRITAPTPLIFNQQPVTYIGSALRQFQFAFTVEDVGPADLYLEEQTIEVFDASGANIPVTLTRDELTNQLYFALPDSLPRDGSADGEYTVKISLVDKAGNRSDSEYTVIYDSKAPQVASAVMNADPPMELILNRIAKIVEPINSITLQFEEATQINFANTQVTLVGPESSDVSDA